MYDIGEKEIKAVRRVIERGSFFRYGGRETAAVEGRLIEIFGCKYAMTVTSGTAALITCLKAMGVGPGQSVLVPGYTFVSTALAVTAAGAIPIYTEVDDRLGICPEDIEKKVEKHTSCILPVHMVGMPCNMRAVKRVARKHKLLVLEDCCQAAGGSFGGKRLGTIGDMGAFSFNQFKIISCGEGGACLTSNKKFAQRAFMAMDGSCSVWPETGKMDEAFFCGGNFRLNEINNSILGVQIDRLDGILGKLRRARKRIQRELRLPGECEIVISHDEEGNCGSTVLLRAPTVEQAVRLEAAITPHIGGFRPINTGRHVYSHWHVVRDKVGGHHPDWDCFRHPKNRGIKTNYKRAMKRTDDLLARSIACGVPYNVSRDDLTRMIRGANQAMKDL